MSNLPAPVEPRALRVTACPHPFRQGHEDYFLVPGESLLAILRQVQPEISRYAAHVWVNEAYIPPARWASTYPAPGSVIAIRVIPQGPLGRAIGAIFIAIAAIAAAILIPGFGASLGLWVAGSMWGTLAGGIAALGVGVLGNMMLNALSPPAVNPRGLNGASTGQSPSLTGAGNQSNLYLPIPRILGRLRYFPPYGAHYYTEVAGSDQYLRLLFCWGWPEIQVEDLKIGDPNGTPLDDYQGVETQHANLTLVLRNQTIAVNVTARTLTRVSGSWLVDGIQAGNTVTLGGGTSAGNNTGYLISEVSERVLHYSQSSAAVSEPGTGAQTATVVFGNSALTLFSRDIYEEGLSIELQYDAHGQPPHEAYVYASQPQAVELSIDFTAPSGLFVSGGGGMEATAARFRVRYRQLGATTWTTVQSNFTMNGSGSGTLRAGLRWTTPDPEAQYEVEVYRLDQSGVSNRSDTVYWTALRTIRPDKPVNFPYPLALTALRIKASGQLNGTVAKFSGIVTSICRDWDADSQTWITRPTQNPASLYLEALTGRQFAKRLPDGRLDLAALQAWHEYCVAQGWQYNKAIDYDVDIQTLLQEIASSGRAAFAWLDNLVGVIIDQPQPFAIGPVFSPRNSAGFQSTITYPDLPHAWRVSFKNELNDWADDERVVLDDGYADLNSAGDPVDAWGNLIEQASGALAIGSTYKILACAADYFYAGCAVGDVFEATAATALSAANKVSLPLATKFEQLPLAGVTHPDLAFKHGRYHIAVARIQFESHEFTTDLEHLVATRGDRIKFAHDVLLVGLGWGRVQELIWESLPDQALALAGGAYASCPDHADFTPAGAFSLEAVVKFTGLGNQVIAGKFGGAQGYWLEIYGGVARATVQDSGHSRQAAANTPPPAGAWCYLVMTWNPADELRIYLNGLEQPATRSGAVAAMDFSNNYPFDIGWLPDKSPLAAAVDLIRWDRTRALSAGQIAQNWADIQNGWMLPGAATACWPFQGDLQDAGPGAHDLTYHAG